MSCLSVVGWIFTVVCTYSGFILLFVGTMVKNQKSKIKNQKSTNINKLSLYFFLSKNSGMQILFQN